MNVAEAYNEVEVLSKKQFRLARRILICIGFCLRNCWVIFHGEHSRWCHLLSWEFNYISVLLHYFSGDAKRFNCRCACEEGKKSLCFCPSTAIKLSNLLLQFYCCINTRSGLDLNKPQFNFPPSRNDDKHRIITQTSLGLRSCSFSLFDLLTSLRFPRTFCDKKWKFWSKIAFRKPIQ